MKENNNDVKKGNDKKFYILAIAVLIILIGFAFVSSRDKTTNDENISSVDTVDNVNDDETVQTTGDEEESEEIVVENNDIVIGGKILSGLSNEEKVTKCSEVVFSKSFQIDGKTFVATEVAVENLEDGYIFYKVCDVSDKSDYELMLINLNGDLDSNLALSFLTSYYYLVYYNQYGEKLDTEFAPIDVQMMGNVIYLTNENVTYDFKYTYTVDGDAYIFTEVN